MQPRRLPLVTDISYGSGWRFETEYFDLHAPIPKAVFSDRLVRLIVKHYPIDRNANVRQGYFFPFDQSGTHEVLQYVKELLPEWLSSLLPRRGDSGAESLEEMERLFKRKVSESLNLPSKERRARLANAQKHPSQTQVLTTVFVRNPDVVAEVLSRAHGRCELCKSSAPFLRASDGSPYLEVHHRVWLADGGDDTLENSIALCPNCHRKAHYG